MKVDPSYPRVGRASPADRVPALIAILGGQCPPYGNVSRHRGPAYAPPRGYANRLNHDRRQKSVVPPIISRAAIKMRQLKLKNKQDIERANAALDNLEF